MTAALVVLGPVHAATVAALHARCFESSWDEAALAALLAMPGAFGWIAVEEDRGQPEPTGFILCRVAADECEVLTVCVLPEKRRSGIARGLLEAACSVAARMGAGAMLLEVAADNDAAGGLYQKARFFPVGHRQGYYPRPDSTAVAALILRRELF